MRGMVDVAVAVVSFVDVGQFVSLAFVGMLMFPTGHSWDTRSHISLVFSTLYSFHFFLGQFVLICRYILSISTNPYIHCYVRIIFHSSVSTYPISSSPPLYCVAILSLSLHFFFNLHIGPLPPHPTTLKPSVMQTFANHISFYHIRTHTSSPTTHSDRSIDQNLTLLCTANYSFPYRVLQTVHRTTRFNGS